MLSPKLKTSLAAVLGLVALGACRLDMHDQPKLKPYRQSDFFQDGRADQAPVPNTVARGELYEGDALVARTGKGPDGKLLAQIPLPVDKALLERGKSRYDVYCSPCHDHSGGGNGMIVRRGLKKPPSFHLQRLKEADDGYFFDVMTNGFGAMYSYSASVRPNDRWAIVAYVRALQLSQDARTADVAADARVQLEGGAQ